MVGQYQGGFPIICTGPFLSTLSTCDLEKGMEGMCSPRGGAALGHGPGGWWSKPGSSMCLGSSEGQRFLGWYEQDMARGTETAGSIPSAWCCHPLSGYHLQFQSTTQKIHHKVGRLQEQSDCSGDRWWGWRPWCLRRGFWMGRFRWDERRLQGLQQHTQHGWDGVQNM